MAGTDGRSITAQDVADYFLAGVNVEAGDNISNLKLQKLLYYAQGLTLAIRGGEPLFDDEVKAWSYGPVVPDLYHKYKPYGAGAIPRPAEFDDTKFDETTREILDEVAEVYGQFSAARLMDMTHEEAPWKTTEIDGVISREKMRDYFETQLIDG